MDEELIIYLWSIMCGAIGGVGRFCWKIDLYKKWKLSAIFYTIFAFGVVGAVCAMIVVGWYFEDTLVKSRLKAFAVATASGYMPVELFNFFKIAFAARNKTLESKIDNAN